MLQRVSRSAFVISCFLEVRCQFSVFSFSCVVLCAGPGGDLLKRYARFGAKRPPQITNMRPGGSRNPSTIIQNDDEDASGDFLEASCFQHRE